MHLRNDILKEHSRENTLRIAKWIGNKPDRVTALMELFLHDEYRVVQRAAWILSHVAEKHPALVEPHLHQMVDRMGHPGIPVAVKRNVVRILQFLPVPENLQGPVMDYCFRFLEDPQETVAVRAFSMTVLANLAEQYPEIRNEIVLLIEDQLREGATPGFKSRGKKTLARLAKGHKN
ncbi:hypothetical protein EGT74_14860 [Chitinophaga lutea]|uniref:HEAT repeat domain-containing protein n=1 Tax=Chitinophaga lutea TaxID=2488634 RepID=A0A3N4PI12_9BACT|nr:hypothetical protein [Chitinophaga lutea]RPE08332.1 hypothetical protein EGT74_14860 [Chitinophaga lutea]